MISNSPFQRDRVSGHANDGLPPLLVLTDLGVALLEGCCRGRDTGHEQGVLLTDEDVPVGLGGSWEQFRPGGGVMWRSWRVRA